MALVDDIRAILDEEAFWDVHLSGYDADLCPPIPATKVILAARSPVFKRMFFGEFRETNDSTVSFPQFSTVVLHAIVRFLHTDSIDLDLIYSDEDESSESDPPDSAAAQESEGKETKNDAAANIAFNAFVHDREARLLVEFRAAADFFELPNLHETLTLEICDTMARDDPMVTCAILDSTTPDDAALWNIGQALLKTRGKDIMLPQSSYPKRPAGVLSLSSAVLTKVCDLIPDPAVVAEAITIWYQHYKDETTGLEGGSSSTPSSPLEVAQGIASTIDLRTLTAPELARIEPSDIFPMERIFEILRMTTAAAAKSGTPSSHYGKTTLVPSPKNKRPDDMFYVVIGGSVKECNGLYRSSRLYTILGENFEYRFSFPGDGRGYLSAVVENKVASHMYSFQLPSSRPFDWTQSQATDSVLEVKVEKGGQSPLPHIYYFSPNKAAEPQFSFALPSNGSTAQSFGSSTSSGPFQFDFNRSSRRQVRRTNP